MNLNGKDISAPSESFFSGTLPIKKNFGYIDGIALKTFSRYKAWIAVRKRKL